MGNKDIHAIVVALLAALFRTHARLGATVMMDVYCELTDAANDSVRAPDIVVVNDLAAPKDANYTGTPTLAVEVRGTQSKRYLEEKVKLYLEHEWPCTWIVHVERQEIEVLRPGCASVLYRRGTSVPLPVELDRHGLAALPVVAAFEAEEASRYSDGWVAARARARSVLAALTARGFHVTDDTKARVLACANEEQLTQWLILAVTAPSAEAFAAEIA